MAAWLSRRSSPEEEADAADAMRDLDLDLDLVKREEGGGGGGGGTPMWNDSADMEEMKLGELCSSYTCNC